jgi:DegV family protein with EDD domain
MGDTATEVTVVADSSICLMPEAARELGITVVPIYAIAGGRTMRDLIEVAPRDIYRAMRDGSADYTTAAPSAADYVQAFASAPGDVLCLTVSAKLTNMYDAAHLSLEMLKDERRVLLVDTGTAASGVTLLALAAAKRAREGMGLDALAAHVRALAQHVHLFAGLESIEHLARSGRVPQAAHWGTRLLGIAPVVQFSGGDIALVQMARRGRGVRQSVVKLVRRSVEREGGALDGEGVRLIVFHADCEGDARELEHTLREQLPASDVIVSEFSPALGIHTGPGVVGAAVLVEQAA